MENKYEAKLTFVIRTYVIITITKDKKKFGNVFTHSNVSILASNHRY